MGRHVTVHHAQTAAALGQAVGVLEAPGDLGADLRRQGGREGDAELATALAELPERRAVDVLHREEVALIVPAKVEDLHDVGVVQPRGQAGLGDEHLHELLVVAEERPHDLDDHVFGEAFGAHGAGQVDLGHPAFGELLLHQIPANRCARC